MKKLAMALLVVFVGVGIFGCGKESCSCENKKDEMTVSTEKEKVNRSQGVYGDGVWILDIDIKKDRTKSTISYINTYLSLVSYSKEGNRYSREFKYADPEYTRFVAVNIYESVYDKNNQTIVFSIWLKDSKGNLMSPYDGPGMESMEIFSLLVDKIENGEIK